MSNKPTYGTISEVLEPKKCKPEYVHLEQPAIELEPKALADDLGREDEILKDSVVNGRKRARAAQLKDELAIRIKRRN